jgi:uncharacterized protein YecE (DUF72 family)
MRARQPRSGAPAAVLTGRLYAGTSGFAYPDWAPRFYPSGLRGDELLAYYASAFRAVELNNTFYARPTEAKIRGWLAATGPDFRFVVKAQRGGSLRAFLSAPAESVPWLTEPLPAFGARLGAVLFRVPANVHRAADGSTDGRVAALLAAWPVTLPLTLEFQHASWHVDEVLDLLREAGTVLCATELPEDEAAPTLRLTGSFLYLRLRRHDYPEPEIEAWAERLAPFLEAGRDVFAFFRHDESGRATELARKLVDQVGRRLPDAVS